MILVVPLSAGFLKGAEEEKCLAADLSEFNLFFLFLFSLSSHLQLTFTGFFHKDGRKITTVSYLF